MLRKFNFPGFHQSSSVYRNRRYLNAKLATLTPLGISQPLRSKNECTKEKFTPFEETIKRDKSSVKADAEYRFGDDYRENDEEIKKEEYVCGLDDADPFRSPLHNASRPGSRSPPKIDRKGTEKENQKPDKNIKSAAIGQYDRILTNPSQTSQMAPFIISQASDTVLPPIDYEPGSNFQGPDLSLLGDRAVSSISLPSTASQASTKSSEDNKPSHEKYRKVLCESDADDEASDKETHHGSDEEPVEDVEQSRYEDFENVHELQSAMDKIQLGKRTRDGDDDGGRSDVNRSELGLRSAPPAEQLMLEMRDPREAERERDIAKDMEAQTESAKTGESAGPAKRRKGSDGQLVGMVGPSLDAPIDGWEIPEGELVSGMAENHTWRQGKRMQQKVAGEEG